eukprot:1111461-Rhodomonas_salina.1
MSSAVYGSSLPLISDRGLSVSVTGASVVGGGGGGATPSAEPRGSSSHGSCQHMSVGVSSWRQQRTADRSPLMCWVR